MIKVVWNVVKKVFGIVLLIFSPLKRLWCRRKRRTSDPILPISNHYPSVENLNTPYSSINGTGQLQADLAPWDLWEDQNQEKVRSVEEYRQRQQMQRQQSEELEPEPDYFQDMTPTLKKQRKVLIKKKEEQINRDFISSKLSMNSDVPLMQTNSELGSWEEQNNAWDDEADDDLTWEADNVIREQRKLDRQQRQLEHQRRKQEREQQRHSKPQSHLSAVKLS